MKITELLSNPEVRSHLSAIAPLSPFTGNPLTLAHDGVALRWENCMEPQWWFGQQDGVYTHQIRLPLTGDQVSTAALAAGLDRDTVALAIAAWEAETARARTALVAESAAQDDRVLENSPEAIRLIIKRIEEKRSNDSNPAFGVRKQRRLEAALEGKWEALSYSDRAEINLIAGTL